MVKLVSSFQTFYQQNSLLMPQIVGLAIAKHFGKCAIKSVPATHKDFRDCIKKHTSLYKAHCTLDWIAHRGSQSF